MDPSAPDAMTLSVVLPAYQEEENLRVLLPRIVLALHALRVPSEVVVVDTMTPLDATGDVCKAMQVRYEPREGGNSFGDAVRTGIARARGRFIIFMDSDGSHSPECIAELFAHRDDSDVVIASRYVENGATENNWMLVVMSRVLNWTYAAILGIRCRDVSNSFRLYDGAKLKAIKLRCDNFDIVEEILLKLTRQNHALRIVEIPITFKQRMFGRTKRKLLLFVLTYVFTLIRLRFFV